MRRPSENIYAVHSFIQRQRRQLRWMLRPRRSVPVGTFDAAANRWKDIDVAGTVERSELTVLTYNVWFSDHFAGQRFQAIADLLSRDMPDIMVFQEITPTALTVFLDQTWIRESYYRATVAGDDFGNYGMLMLSTMPISRATYTRLPTRLGRGYLCAEVTVNGNPMVVCSVHLESGKAAAGLRVRQLHRVFHSLRTADEAVVLGDFNMRNAENTLITAPYCDVWPVLRPNDAWLHRRHVHQPHALRQQEQAPAGAVRSCPLQRQSMGARSHRTAGDRTDFERAPPGLPVRSLRRPLPPRQSPRSSLTPLPRLPTARAASRRDSDVPAIHTSKVTDANRPTTGRLDCLTVRSRKRCRCRAATGGLLDPNRHRPRRPGSARRRPPVPPIRASTRTGRTRSAPT